MGRFQFISYCFLISSVISINTFGQKSVWTAVQGGLNEEGPLGLTVDKTGHPVMTGYADAEYLFERCGDHDIFVIRYKKDGTVDWVETAGGPGFDAGYSICSDANNNIFVTGYFYGTAIFGNDTIESKGSKDGFLMKYDSLGNYQWVRVIGGIDYDEGWSVSENNGQVYVSGIFNGTAYCEYDSIKSNGADDIFVTCFTADQGKYQWIRSFGADMYDYPNAIKATAAGIFVGGSFYNTIKFDSANVTSNGSSDCFITKLDIDGNCEWTKSFGSSGPDFLTTLTVNNSGQIIAAGNFSDTLQILSLPKLSSKGKRDNYLVTLENDGTAKWNLSFGNEEQDICYNIATDKSNEIFLTAPFYDTLTISGKTLVSQGKQDAGLFRFDSIGNLIWMIYAGSKSNDEPGGVAVDNEQKLYFTGYFQDTANFGSGLIYSQGHNDIFLSQIDYSIAAGIEQVVSPKKDVNIYPNPSAETIQIAGVSQIRDFKIVDISGRVAYESHKPTQSINVSTLPTGQYHLILNDMEGKQYNASFLKE